jgi:carbon storage regulator
MLVITRQTGDSLLIGENIHITVLEVNGDRVKIGIDAPRSISIVRTEVLDARDSNLEADQSGGALTFRPEKRRLAPEPGAPESPGAGQ